MSRAWRALLADTTLWRSLDLARATGSPRFNEALLRAAAAKAGGQVRALDVTELRLRNCLHDVITANAAALGELRMDSRG